MSESAGNQAAAMDRMYRLTRHVYDLTRAYYLLGRDRMLAMAATNPAKGWNASWVKAEMATSSMPAKVELPVSKSWTMVSSMASRCAVVSGSSATKTTNRE
jgi:hypothetical protein